MSHEFIDERCNHTVSVAAADADSRDVYRAVGEVKNNQFHS
jgi:hypothetical protein